MTQNTYYNIKLGLKNLISIVEIALALQSYVTNNCSIKLYRTYDKKKYKKAIIVVSLCFQEWQLEIKDEQKLDEA
jgi:hypothetical protein